MVGVAFGPPPVDRLGPNPAVSVSPPSTIVRSGHVSPLVSIVRHHLMQRFTVTIEGAGWKDVQELELPRLPREGELIETKYGTCRVTHSESVAKTEGFDGKIVCSNS